MPKTAPDRNKIYSLRGISGHDTQTSDRSNATATISNLARFKSHIKSQQLTHNIGISPQKAFQVVRKSKPMYQSKKQSKEIDQPETLA